MVGIMQQYCLKKLMVNGLEQINMVTNVITNTGYKTIVNEIEETILYYSKWYHVFEDREGEHYFMYDNRAIYFTIDN